MCLHISPWWLWSGLCLGSGDLNTSCPAHDWLLPLSPHNTKIEVSTEFCDSFSNMQMQRLISFVDKCHINLGWTHHVKAPIYGSVLIDSWRHALSNISPHQIIWRLPQNFIDTYNIHTPRNCSDLFQIIVLTLRNQHLFLDRYRMLAFQSTIDTISYSIKSFSKSLSRPKSQKHYYWWHLWTVPQKGVLQSRFTGLVWHGCPMWLPIYPRLVLRKTGHVPRGDGHHIWGCDRSATDQNNITLPELRK